MLLFLPVSTYKPKFLSFHQMDTLDDLLSTKADVLYFGDSTNNSYDASDNDRRTISAMLDSLVPSLRIDGVAGTGYSTDLFLEFCYYLIEKVNHPKAVVMPVNLRLFSPFVDLDPNYRFRREKDLLRSQFAYFVFWRPLEIFQSDLAGRFRAWRYNRSVVMRGNEAFGAVGPTIEFIRENLLNDRRRAWEARMMMDYMPYIGKDHRKLRAVTEAARLLLANGILPVIYITPVNVQLGEEYHPGDFAKIVATNCQLVRQSLDAASTDLLNLSFDLPSDAFADEFVPSGHLKKRGRVHVAQEVSNVLMRTLTGR